MKRRGDTPLDNDLRFLINKLHPSLSLIFDQQRGTNVVGEPFEWKSALLSRITPMGVPDIVDTLKEHGTPGMGYALLGLLGAGLQNFDADRNKVGTVPGLKGVNEDTDKTLLEIERLQDAANEGNRLIGKLSKADITEMYGETATEKQIAERQEEISKAIHSSLKEWVESPEWKEMSDEDKVDTVNKVERHWKKVYRTDNRRQLAQ
jgi:hypothetical protein